MKKIIAIALVVVLALSLLTACGGNSNTPSGGGNSTNSPSNSSTPSGNGGDNSGGNTDKPSGASITPDKTNYALGETIKITLNDVTQEMLDKHAVVCIFKAEAAYDQSLAYSPIEKIGSSTIEISARQEEGNYELRLFNTSARNEETLIQMVPITVGNAQGGEETPSTTPDGNETTPGGNNNGEAIGYPAEWPSDVPKMSGTVKEKMQMAENPKDGYSVTIGNTTLDEVMGYVDTLKGNGYTYNAAKDYEVAYDEAQKTYATTYRNGTWMVGITFTGANKEAVIFFMKDE
jgi:predicted small secreted protein